MSHRTLTHRVHQCLSNVYQAQLYLNGADVTPSQATVLCMLRKSDGPSQAQVVAETGIDRSTMADIVRRLVKKGLVERHRSKGDARAYVLSLTKDGQQMALRAGLVDAAMDKRIGRYAKGFERVMEDVLTEFETVDNPQLVAAE